jgi:hypothetical protein
MKRHGDLFRHIVEPDNLYEAYRNARRGKSWQRVVQAFDQDWEGGLLRLQEMLSTRRFTTAEYRTKTITEPKRRTVYVLPFYPDRIVQHAIIQVLWPIWDRLLIDDTYACRPGKGMHRGSSRCMQFVRQYRYCFKADISKFYPSIDHGVLLGILRQKIKCPDTLALLEDIVRSYPGGKNAPIGNYTSQWFGNLYLNELDQFVKHELKGRAYIRYCDDFVVFANDKRWLARVREAVRDFLWQRLQLTFSRQAVFPVSQGVDFLGYRHWPHKILVRKSTAKRMKRHMARLPGLLARGRITREQYQSSIASTEGWLQWANSYNLRRAMRLDELKEGL